MNYGGYNVSSHFNPTREEGANVQIVLNFEELSQIILAHVRNKMGVSANSINLPGVWTGKADFCVVSTTKQPDEVKLVSPSSAPAGSTEDWP
jgi:hypothetical protein